MSADTAAPVEEVPGEHAVPLPTGPRLRLLVYAAFPVLIFSFAAPYLRLLQLPIIFFLKNRLHLPAHDTAIFNIVAAIPLFLGFVFGFIRDRWSPFGLGDRGHLMVFGSASALAYVAMAFAPPTYLVLLTGCLVVTALLQFVSSASNALASGIGRHHAMSGQVSTAMNVALQLPAALAALLGGVLAGLLEGGQAQAAARTIFLIGAALMAVLAAFGAFGPKQLFDDAEPVAPALSPGRDVLRLLGTWAIYPALLIQILWQFGPGMGVALQYHLSNDIHVTDARIGQFYAIFNLGFLPVYLLYGWLAQRFSLRPLLWLGAALAIPQMASLLFIHSPRDVLLAAIPTGILGGISQAAFMDLAIRSCPKGLEGTMMMLLWSMFWIAVTFGDLWGADLYEHHGGFNTALLATIGVYAAILPVILLIPRRITAGKDA